MIGFANGHKVVDGIEREALKNVFGEDAKKLPVFSVKDKLGEGRAASAALAAAHAALMLHGDIGMQDLYNLDSSEPAGAESPEAYRYILVISCGAGGSYCAAVIGRKDC